MGKKRSRRGNGAETAGTLILEERTPNYGEPVGPLLKRGENLEEINSRRGESSWDGNLLGSTLPLETKRRFLRKPGQEETPI